MNSTSAAPRAPARAATAGSAILALLMLAGCTTTSPDVISRHDAQRMATIIDAVVLTTRSVVVEGTQSGVGASAGAVIGGVAGSSVGGRRDGVVGSVLGAVVGGVVGNAVERFGTREESHEILVQLPSGERRAIVQAKAGETFNPGDRVIIVTTGGKVRVTRAPAAAAPTAAPAKTT